MQPRCALGVVAPPRAKHRSSPFPVCFQVDRPAIWQSQDTWKHRGIGTPCAERQPVRRHPCCHSADALRAAAANAVHPVARVTIDTSAFDSKFKRTPVQQHPAEEPKLFTASVDGQLRVCRTPPNLIADAHTTCTDNGAPHAAGVKAWTLSAW